MATTTDKPNTKTAPKATTNPSKGDVTLSSVYAKYATKRGIDTTRAAKLVRARMRSNFDKVIELDARIAKVKSKPNDGNRWPATISKGLADYLTA